MGRHFRLYWLPVISWAILIFILSSISRFPKQLEPVFSVDKLAHTIEYAIFGFLWARAFSNSQTENFKKFFRILAIICVIVYGITDEWHQSFVLYRTASVMDLLYDSLGGIIGQMFYRKIS
ncbi:MAG: VanZ family protein [Candidatus Omnitrophica bacterium]|nr:VanZ family protein [Candidatus Omnitrophota bacterium]